MTTSKKPAMYESVTDPTAFASQIGTAMAKSGMFGLPNVEAGIVVAMTCFCEGISPLDFGRKYHVIKGKPSMRADAMLAEFRVAGGRHKVIARNSECATVELTFEDETEKFSFSWEEAQKEPFVRTKEGGLKGNWATPRVRMQTLWARVVSDGVRTTCPEIVAGIYTPQETEDFSETETLVSPEVKALTVDEAASKSAETTVAEQTVAVSMPPTKEESVAVALANDLQQAKIDSLFRLLKTPEQTISSVLQKRNCTAIEQLSSVQADDIIEKLEAMSSAKK